MKSSVALRFFMVLILLWPCYKDLNAQTSSCDEIKVKVIVTPTSEGKDNGKISLSFENSAELFNIHILQSNSFYRLNYNKTTIPDLKKGSYTIVVTAKEENSTYCSKNLEVKIQ